MNLLIYVLLLSIWTTKCSNISRHNESSTVGLKSPDAYSEDSDMFKKHLINIVTGIMFVIFLSTCFCMIHYNCMIEPLKDNSVKNEGTGTTLSCPPVLPLNDSKKNDLNLCSPKKQGLLSNKGNLPRPSTTETSSIPSSAGKLNKQLRSKKSFKSSSRAEAFKSPYLKKSHKMRLKKKRKLNYIHKHAAQVHSAEEVRVLLQDNLQSLGGPYPENQTLPAKPMKLNKPPKTHRPKMSGSAGKTHMVPKPRSSTSCHYYKERCLVCKTSKTLASMSEKKKKAECLPVSSEIISFSRSLYKVDSQDHAYIANVGDNGTIDSDDDSDKEITIILNVTSNDLFLRAPYKN
ncbi:PREDICTED: uncharacterized protein CXorf66 homolog [Chinchilla lanigera]|uniref:Uncharacterized protein n=1 Tax=Chinchilla lanigera TaxID=34839 RepID=A0A8C2URN4_CHILA|nr:PREDICTED: uncharacterized protein CXorf66 homolog [Chinchilla lanigera]